MVVATRPDNQIQNNRMHKNIFSVHNWQFGQSNIKKPRDPAYLEALSAVSWPHHQIGYLSLYRFILKHLKTYLTMATQQPNTWQAGNTWGNWTRRARKSIRCADRGAGVRLFEPEMRVCEPYAVARWSVSLNSWRLAKGGDWLEKNERDSETLHGKREQCEVFLFACLTAVDL